LEGAKYKQTQTGRKNRAATTTGIVKNKVLVGRIAPTHGARGTPPTEGSTSLTSKIAATPFTREAAPENSDEARARQKGARSNLNTLNKI